MKQLPKPEDHSLQQKIDALVEFVHRGCGSMLDVGEVLDMISSVLKPNCSMNYEYRFAWNDDCDPNSLEIDWKQPSERILQESIKSQDRIDAIQAGACLTADEKQAYRQELARRDHGYKTALERLESNDDCKWVDLSYVTDSQGRQIYLLEMGDAVVPDDADSDTVTKLYDDIWRWKNQPLSIFGPFRSVKEAEDWMEKNGAFEEID